MRNTSKETVGHTCPWKISILKMLQGVGAHQSSGAQFHRNRNLGIHTLQYACLTLLNHQGWASGFGNKVRCSTYSGTSEQTKPEAMSTKPKPTKYDSNTAETARICCKFPSNTEGGPAMCSEAPD